MHLRRVHSASGSGKIPTSAASSPQGAGDQSLLNGERYARLICEPSGPFSTIKPTETWDRGCRCRLKLLRLPGLLAGGGLHRGHAQRLRKRRCLWRRFGLFGFRLPFLAIASLFTLCHDRSPRGSRVGGDACVDLHVYRQRVLLGRAKVVFPIGHAAESAGMDRRGRAAPGTAC